MQAAQTPHPGCAALCLSVPSTYNTPRCQNVGHSCCRARLQAVQASHIASASLGAAKRREKEALDRAQFLEDERAARESTLAELQASYQLSQSEARLDAAVRCLDPVLVQSGVAVRWQDAVQVQSDWMRFFLVGMQLHCAAHPSSPRPNMMSWYASAPTTIKPSSHAQDSCHPACRLEMHIPARSRSMYDQHSPTIIRIKPAASAG